MTTTLIIPGLNSSGLAHWQTWFETRLPDAVRVVQSDWKSADLPQWSRRVRREISRHEGPILIAAHSFGVLAAVQAAEDHRERIAGALLVAPADPDKFGVSEHLPQGRLGFPTTIVASLNDPWLSIDKAARLAARWGSNFIDIGAAGHINAETGFGPWPYGLALLQQLDPQRAADFESATSEPISRQPASHSLRPEIAARPKAA
ncbi:MAG: alpha/beta hydrolase [Hyphomicrobium sp.]|jgi:predicted alpha/beta hydrolase family esterase|uniref:RBBP9/YdeN family alpha/beta hydrolase n=1 Tax=Hyphomicrobium sp. TaxID=82 RepID=UPI0025C01508|nr:alpha/beta hydrolase [Hyphomicrobium sp.]MBX9861131.1 alpha/beta hydrolase [Hyphomicrobium sp.]